MFRRGRGTRRSRAAHENVEKDSAHIVSDPALEAQLRLNASSRVETCKRLDAQVEANSHLVTEDANSEMQCRLCLRPGERRRCCEQWYCNACYYRGKTCPSCGFKVQERNVGIVEDANKEKLTFTLLFSLFFFAGVAGSASVMLYHYVTVPTTLHGFTCAGLLPTCAPGCLEHHRPADAGFSHIRDWVPCTRSSRNKLRGPMCVTDRTLYERSGRKLGYDFCVTGAEEAFEPSLIVFEDDMNDAGNEQRTFEYRWNLASAKWRYVVNGAREGSCGALDDRNVGTDAKTTLTPSEAKPKGMAVLHFYGDHEREAVTEPADLRHGGRLEFWFKYAKGHYAGCEVQYDGTTTLAYSVDNGVTWTEWDDLNRILWRTKAFNLWRKEVPKAARSAQTMFRWQQTLFNPLRDHWALDNVRIFRYPERDWRGTQEHKAIVAAGAAFSDRARCCLDSFGCDTVGDKTKWNNETCADLLRDPHYGDFSVLEDNLKGRELAVVLALLCFVVRFAFDVVVYMITHLFHVPRRVQFWAMAYEFLARRCAALLAYCAGAPSDQQVAPLKPAAAAAPAAGMAIVASLAKAKAKLKERAGINSTSKTRYDAHFKTRCSAKWRRIFVSVIAVTFCVTLTCLFALQLPTRRPFLRVAVQLPVGLRAGRFRPRNLEQECRAHTDQDSCTAGDEATGDKICVWSYGAGGRNADDGSCDLQEAVRRKVLQSDTMLSRTEYFIPYAALALAAAAVDVLVMWRVAQHVVCVTDKGAPRYEFDGRRNKLLITNCGFGRDQEIDLAAVTELRQFSDKTARGLGLQILFMSLPLLTLTLLCADRFFAIVLGMFCVARSIFGPFFLVKFFWVLNYLYSAVVVCNPQYDYLRIEFANALFRPYTLAMMILWAAVGGPASLGALWIFDVPSSPNLAFATAFWAMVGGLVGGAQGIPTHPVLFMTCLDVGFFVRYRKVEKLKGMLCCPGAWMSKITSCEAMLVAYVENQPVFNDLLRGIPLDAEEAKDMRSASKYEYSSEESGSEEDDVVGAGQMARDMFAAHNEVFQGHETDGEGETSGAGETDDESHGSDHDGAGIALPVSAERTLATAAAPAAASSAAPTAVSPAKSVTEI
eukprot:g5448.t1